MITNEKIESLTDYIDYIENEPSRESHNGMTDHGSDGARYV